MRNPGRAPALGRTSTTVESGRLAASVGGSATRHGTAGKMVKSAAIDKKQWWQGTPLDPYKVLR